ncbi:MAG TPA: SDR family oxidoreductase [Vicinamibacteria bacterium]|nr:SDR family oxidoreductase [Vicinamibacteria bacterium]
MSHRTVVVTGASSGIGRATARYLHEREFRVFGGVRNEADAAALREEGIEPLLLDVTDVESITRAAERAGDEIFGLVNNAGISVAGPLELLPLSDIRRQLEVNVVGQIAVTQAFLAAIRAARGRIINMSSISGRLAPPFLGPYAMSKFALEAFSDSLRRELEPFGVEVVSIEPGAIATPIWEKSIAAATERTRNITDDRWSLYRDIVGRMVELARTRANSATPVEEVARVVYEALTTKRPRTRYLVGRDARLRGWLAWILPDRALDWLIRRQFRANPEIK